MDNSLLLENYIKGITISQTVGQKLLMIHFSSEKGTWTFLLVFERVYIGDHKKKYQVQQLYHVHEHRRKSKQKYQCTPQYDEVVRGHKPLLG